MQAGADENLFWTPSAGERPALGAARLLPGALEAFGTELASPDALAVRGIAPTPQWPSAVARQDRRRLRRADRERNLELRARRDQQALHAEQLDAPTLAEVLTRSEARAGGARALNTQTPNEAAR